MQLTGQQPVSAHPDPVRSPRDRSPSADRDRLTTGIAFSLAGASTLFALYMMLAGPEGPNLPALTASAPPMGSFDQMTTAALPGFQRRMVQGRPPGNTLYRIVAVANGRAWLEMEGDPRSRLLGVSPGMTLAGLGRVLSVKRDGNRWVMRTTMGTLVGAADPPDAK